LVCAGMDFSPAEGILAYLAGNVNSQ
jgi:hypothetical protein